jgi:type III pantothenate kinase
MTEDEYFSTINVLLENSSIECKRIDKLIISSVVPSLTRVFSHMAEKYFESELLNVTPYLDLGLKFPMSDPGFIGADLIVNAYAVKELYGKNCIVCDFGTATTIQLVGADGYFHGTIIAPGVLTASANLFQKASLLAAVQLKKPETLLGTTTETALQTGIVTANAIMLDGLIERIRAQYKDLGEIFTVATGGIAELICGECEHVDHIEKNLTLIGLNLIGNKYPAHV